MILVQLGKDCGHLALAEGVVERIVHVGHGNAKPGCGVAVDDQVGRQSLVLQIAGHVGHDTFLAQLAHHPTCVDTQLVLVRIFQRILELGAAYAIFHGQILKRLQEELDPFHGVYLALHALNHFRR